MNRDSGTVEVRVPPEGGRRGVAGYERLEEKSTEDIPAAAGMFAMENPPWR